MSDPGNRRSRARAAADAFGIIAFAVLAWYLWPASLGGNTRFVVVQGHSMEPTFHMGDALIVKANPRPHVGDIVVFRIPAGEPAEGKLVVHRVHSIRPNGTFETQGDNRTTADVFQVTDHDVVGSPVRSIPRLGRLIGLASSPIAVGLTTGLIATMLLWPKQRPINEPGRPAHHQGSPLGEHDVDTEAQAWLEAELALFTAPEVVAASTGWNWSG